MKKIIIFGSDDHANPIIYDRVITDLSFIIFTFKMRHVIGICSF